MVRPETLKGPRSTLLEGEKQRRREPQIPENTENTEKTDGHRGGRRASARRTARIGNRRLRRLEPIIGRLPPAGRTIGSLEVWAGRTLRGYHKGHEGPQRNTKERTQGAGRACAQGARPAREPVRAWRASHATLWFLGVHPAQRLARRPTGAFRSLFSVLRSPGRASAPCPIDPICPTALPVGTSQTCRGCRENFSLPGCGAAPHFPIS